MEITYTWDCGTVDTYTSHTDAQDPANTQSDVIYNVHYTLSGVATVEETEYYASVIGTQTLSTDDLTSFTSFETLTHADLVTWTKAALGADKVSSLETSVSASIADKIAPKTVTRRITE